jgi:anti-anti-sigma factor
MRSAHGLSIRNRGRTIEVAGELDVHTCQAMEQCLAEAPGDGDVLVDLSAVDFIDSTGLRVLVLEHQRLGNHYRQLRLLNPSGAVMRLLVLTRLDRTLVIDA